MVGCAMEKQTLSQEEASAKDTDGRHSCTIGSRLLPLWPLALGLTFGRAGLIVACYGSYTQTDEGLFTDGAMLVALAIMLAPFAILAIRKVSLSKAAVNRIMWISIALETATIVGLGVADLVGNQSFALRFVLSVTCTFTSSFAIFYWLRRARGTGTLVAAAFVFSALVLSEIELYIATFLPIWLGNFLAAALALVQYPCMAWSRKQLRPHEIDASAERSDYFSFAGTMMQNVRFLIATAVGIGLLAIVVGLLRGYPSGASIPFAYATRLAYCLLTIALSVVIVVLVAQNKRSVMTIGIFILMEGLACLALICYAAFPDSLDIGAVFTTTLNALMVAFVWYVVIAFMSYGWRDPYYYAMAGWFVWLGSRAVSRMALLFVYQISANDMLMCSAMGALVVLSTQITLVQFLKIASKPEKTRKEPVEEADEIEDTPLVRIMGLDNAGSLSASRQEAMRHSVEIMGSQFMLSERERDVLTLYAMGFTQKRVAEELFISPGTAHSHIKRIYAKTGMHSRQEILDYIEQYAQ